MASSKEVRLYPLQMAVFPFFGGGSPPPFPRKSIGKAGAPLFVVNEGGKFSSQIGCAKRVAGRYRDAIEATTTLSNTH
ncbi:MAG: hypothetical protein JO273_07925 [Methylobacteriaceae bacterium]|nr:hypothetical protein [Methylobacteriaceae bacterium]